MHLHPASQHLLHVPPGQVLPRLDLVSCLIRHLLGHPQNRILAVVKPDAGLRHVDGQLTPVQVGIPQELKRKGRCRRQVEMPVLVDIHVMAQEMRQRAFEDHGRGQPSTARRGRVGAELIPVHKLARAMNGVGLVQDELAAVSKDISLLSRSGSLGPANRGGDTFSTMPANAPVLACAGTARANATQRIKGMDMLRVIGFSCAMLSVMHRGMRVWR